MSVFVLRHEAADNNLPPYGGGPFLCWKLVEPSLQDASDADLLQRMAQGDRLAFGDFYDRHSPALFGLALRMMGDPREAEDVLQDALVQLWERAGKFDSRLGRPMSWAFTLVRNRAIDRLRSLRRQSQVFEPSSEATNGAEGVSEAFGPEETLATSDAALVRQALGALPPDQRQAIELAFFGGLSQSEIAEKLSQPLGTVKARIRRGMQKLREVLETEWKGPEFSTSAEEL